MTPEQRVMLDHVVNSARAVTNTTANGPFNVLLRSPEIGDLSQQLGNTLRFASGLSGRLREIATLMAGRAWSSHYEWYAHRRAAATNGVKEETIQAIAAGRRPTTMQPDEEIVYNFCTELLNNKQVSDQTFQATKDKFGERGVVDLIGVSGYYGLVSMLLNVDRYPLPDGVQPELKPLR